jgi:hypothetical protein
MNRRFIALLAVLLLVAGATPRALWASSHSEAPGTAKDRLADDTDVYAWVSPDAADRVTFVGNWVPLLEPNGGPNFYGFDEDARYYVNIDNVGDAQDHIRYQFKFRTDRRNPNTFLYNTGAVTSLDDPDLNVRQFATVTRYDNGVATVLATDVPVAPNNVGPASMPRYEQLAQQAVFTLPDGSKLFIGPRDDPFFVDLAAIFDLLTIRKVPGDRGRGVDGLGGFNCMSIVLQVPMTRLTADGQAPNATNGVIGIYDSVERFTTRTLNGDGTTSVSGPEVQVSRLGMPLVNEVVIPVGMKDKFNATKPTGDGVFLPFVVNPELAGLLTALYGIPTPAAPRNDLVAVFLTGIPGLNQPASAAAVPNEMLRLNMAIPPATEAEPVRHPGRRRGRLPERAALVRRCRGHRRACGRGRDAVHARLQCRAEQPARRRRGLQRPAVPAPLPVCGASPQPVRPPAPPRAARARAPAQPLRRRRPAHGAGWRGGGGGG